jgi:hypothetical protein
MDPTVAEVHQPFAKKGSATFAQDARVTRTGGFEHCDYKQDQGTGDEANTG